MYLQGRVCILPLIRWLTFSLSLTATLEGFTGLENSLQPALQHVQVVKIHAQT